MLLIYFWRLHADGRDANAARIEVRKPLLETPQLGVAEQSPVPAIENQQRSVGARRALGRRFKKISQRDWLAIFIR